MATDSFLADVRLEHIIGHLRKACILRHDIRNILLLAHLRRSQFHLVFGMLVCFFSLLRRDLLVQHRQVNHIQLLVSISFMSDFLNNESVIFGVALRNLSLNHVDLVAGIRLSHFLLVACLPVLGDFVVGLKPEFLLLLGQPTIDHFDSQKLSFGRVQIV